MNDLKYFDWKTGKSLNPPKKGCSIDEWIVESINFSYAIHSDGFLAFLPKEELKSLDEYENGDPYGIEDNINSPFHQGRAYTTIELLKPIIAGSDRKVQLLDVGCGQGHITSKVLDNFPNLSVSGIDVSLSAIKYANQNFKGIDFVVGDACNPPYAASYFDIIICNNMYEHITDPVKLLFNLKKILSADGLIILSTPSRFRSSNLVKAFLGKKLSINKHHVTEYTVGQVIEQLSFAGFNVNKVKGLELKLQGGTFCTRLFIHKVFKSAVNVIIRFMRSHHVLDSTVFYVAQKKQ